MTETEVLDPMADIKIGDLVRLKCGGPTMCVEMIQGNDLTVVWMNADSDMQRAILSKNLFDLEYQAYHGEI